MTCVMNNSVRIPFRSYFELGAKQELFSEIVNITHTTLKKHKDSLEMYYGIIMESGWAFCCNAPCVPNVPYFSGAFFIWPNCIFGHTDTYFFIFWLICSLCLVVGIGEHGRTSHLWFFMWMFYVCGWCEGTKSTRCKSNHCKIVLLKYKSGNSHTGSEFT